MRSAAAAIAWELRQRHRWGLIAVVGTLAIVGVITLVVRAQRIDLGTDVAFAFVVLVPLAAAVMYFLAVFTFGLSGDIAARESMYPPRMFTLPVSSSALAGWPMLYGGVAIALLWLAARAAGAWPTDVYVPIWWPSFFAVALLAWAQALTWMSYPLRGMRIVVTIILLTSIDITVFTAMEVRSPEWLMILIMLPHPPIAYFVARYAVRRARCGDVPDWGHMFRSRAAAADVTARFASPARAQMWLEWKQHGTSLPSLMAILLPIQLLFLYLFRETDTIVIESFIIILITPPLMAVFVAPSVGKAMTPFIATRPIDDATLIGAKLRTAWRSTLAAWLLVAVALPAGLYFSGTVDVITSIGHRVNAALGTPRAVVLGLLLLAALMGATWKLLVQSMYIGMTGREWLVKGTLFGTLALLTILFPLALWVLSDRRLTAIVITCLPAVFAVAVLAKCAAAFWVVSRSYARGALSRRQLLIAAVTWDLAVFAIFATFAWIVPAILISRHFLLMLAILGVPFVRLVAAPLSVAANRHR